MINLKKFVKIKIRGIVSRMHSLKFKFIIIIVLFLSYFVIFFVMVEMWYSAKSDGVTSQLDLEHVIVHIDMKGSPPMLSYLKSLLPKLKELGATGLLLEYEDMFPYEGRLINISATNCYDKSELYEFVSSAIRSGFEIIPLVQTFGHMEHVLKLAEFRHLREVPLYPDSICPSKAETQGLIKNMLEQVLSFHNEIKPLKHFHIGCDEVYQINKCHLCARRGLRDTEIYIKHLKTVTDFLKAKSPNTTVMIWDDGLRNIPVYQWDSLIQNMPVEPVYWDYGVSSSVSHVNLMKYNKKFKNIWAASAFKGADGRSATLPDVRRRLLNHFSWLTFMHNYKFGGEEKVYSFKGIILTGWSRYSHFDPPCEILPVSIPSLYLNLILIKHFKNVGYSKHDDGMNLNLYISKYLSEEFKSTMNCAEELDIDYIDSYKCLFDGNKIYSNMRHLEMLLSDLATNMYDKSNDLSSIAFYSKTFNVNMNKLKDNINYCNDTFKELWYMERNLRTNMKLFLDESFVNEYVDYKFYNFKIRIDELLKYLNGQMKVRSWSRRPYH